MDSGNSLDIYMTPPPFVDFDLELYYPNGALKEESHQGAGATETIQYTADVGGAWKIRVYKIHWSGVYQLNLSANHSNAPPLAPSKPSGTASGYVYTTYSYSTNTTDPNGNNVRYNFLWYDGSNKTTDWNASGATVTEQHSWTRPHVYPVYVRAQDVYEAWSGWSWSLTVNITQNDAGSGKDAGNNSTSSLSIPAPTEQAQWYDGTLYQYNPEDEDDWYKFYVANNKEIHIMLTSPTGADFNIELRDPNGVLKQSSTMPTGYVDVIDYVTSMSGNWKAHIYASSGEGQYDFSIRISEPGGGGGGGDGCPTLFAWNGSNYVNYGVINIHNSSGEDVVREVQVNKTDVAVNNYRAKFRLQEGWQGLNFSESVIDQVKLYVIDSYGNHRLCPLIIAVHSQVGNVLPRLLLSDEWKIQTLLLETIDLTFFVPYQNIQSVTFVIEGCNQFKQ